MQLTYAAGSTTTIGVGVGGALPDGVGSCTAQGTFTKTSTSAETFPVLTGKIVDEQTPYSFGEYAVVCGLLRRFSPRSGRPAATR
jgi:hypothetical protein